MFPVLRIFSNGVISSLTSSFHHLCKPSSYQNAVPALLVPVVPSIIPNCGFKVHGRVHRRCRDCFFVRRQERLFVLCKTHPRHKQMSMVKDPKSTWILTHATQSKVRPW